MSDLQGTETAITTTVNCASAKILSVVDSGADKEELRNVVLGELNGIRRFVIKLICNQAEGPLLPPKDSARKGG